MDVNVNFGSRSKIQLYFDAAHHSIPGYSDEMARFPAVGDGILSLFLFNLHSKMPIQTEFCIID
jgi:hypothetical protein